MRHRYRNGVQQWRLVKMIAAALTKGYRTQNDITCICIT